MAIFVASVSAMFGVSALYHRGNWSETWRRRLQRLDHAMIFFLIAGTATPTFVMVTAVFMVIAMWIFPEAGVKKGDVKKSSRPST